MLDFRQPRYVCSSPPPLPYSSFPLSLLSIDSLSLQGGNGSFSYDNVKVVKVEGEGCEKDNYEGVEYCAQVDGGCVALIPRSSTCTLYDSALLAQDAGALVCFPSSSFFLTFPFPFSFLPLIPFLFLPLPFS